MCGSHVGNLGYYEGTHVPHHFFFLNLIGPLKDKKSRPLGPHAVQPKRRVASEQQTTAKPRTHMHSSPCARDEASHQDRQTALPEKMEHSPGHRLKRKRAAGGTGHEGERVLQRSQRDKCHFKMPPLHLHSLSLRRMRSPPHALGRRRQNAAVEIAVASGTAPCRLAGMLSGCKFANDRHKRFTLFRARILWNVNRVWPFGGDN